MTDIPLILLMSLFVHPMPYLGAALLIGIALYGLLSGAGEERKLRRFKRD